MIDFFFFNVTMENDGTHWRDCTWSQVAIYLYIIYIEDTVLGRRCPLSPWSDFPFGVEPGSETLGSGGLEPWSQLCALGELASAVSFLALEAFQLFARNPATEAAILSQVSSRQVCFPLLCRTPGSLGPRDSKLSLFALWGLHWYPKLVCSSIPSCNWCYQQFAAVTPVDLNWPIWFWLLVSSYLSVFTLACFK